VQPSTFVLTLDAKSQRFVKLKELECQLFVRAEENNSYFNTLKNSGIWEAYCGNEDYGKIREYSGYNLKSWIDTNMDWANDFKPETIAHFEELNLLQYLLW